MIWDAEWQNGALAWDLGDLDCVLGSANNLLGNLGKVTSLTFAVLKSSVWKVF